MSRAWDKTKEGTKMGALAGLVGGALLGGVLAAAAVSWVAAIPLLGGIAMTGAVMGGVISGGIGGLLKGAAAGAALGGAYGMITEKPKAKVPANGVQVVAVTQGRAPSQGLAQAQVVAQQLEAIPTEELVAHRQYLDNILASRAAGQQQSSIDAILAKGKQEQSRADAVLAARGVQATEQQQLG